MSPQLIVGCRSLSTSAVRQRRPSVQTVVCAIRARESANASRDTPTTTARAKMRFQVVDPRKQ